MKFMGIVIVIILLVLSTAGCVSDDELKELEDENKKLKKQNELLEEKELKIGADLYRLYQNYTNLSAEIEKKNNTINHYINIIDNLEIELANINNSLYELMNELNITHEMMANKDVTISELEDDISDLEMELARLRLELQQKNNSPSAIVSADKALGPAPLEVSFSSVATDNDGFISEYRWNFGDGEISNTSNPTHTFQNMGEYVVILTVTDDSGSLGTGTIIITVLKQTPSKMIFNGRGDGITDKFYLVEGIVSFETTHNGEHNFAIWLFNLDTSDREDLLVNEIGNYDGKTLIEIDDDGYSDGKSGYHILDIIADGDWEVTIEHL